MTQNSKSAWATFNTLMIVVLLGTGVGWLVWGWQDTAAATSASERDKVCKQPVDIDDDTEVTFD